MEKSTDRKTLIRKRFLDIRREFIGYERERADEAITKLILESEIYRKAGCIFLYASTYDEVDTSVVIRRSLEDGKTVALPKTRGKGAMDFYRVTDVTTLKKGSYGISEPTGDEEIMDSSDADVIFIPGVAFDRDFGRIGYGGGYYDRYLCRDTDAILLGLFFECQFCPELPKEANDKLIDGLITENGILLSDAYRDRLQDIGWITREKDS